MFALLCERCQDIFNHEDIKLFDYAKKELLAEESDPGSRASSDYERSTVRTHHEEVSLMAHWAEWGGYICNMVWRHFFPEKTPVQYRKAPYVFRASRQGHVLSHVFYGSGTHYILGRPDKALGERSENVIELRIGLNSPINQDDHIPEYKTIILSPLEEELQAGNDIGLDHTFQNPPSDEFNESTLQTINAWLHKCDSSHTGCKERGRDPWYPTRLLDICAPIQDDSDSMNLISLLLSLKGVGTGIRLIETKDSPPDGPYMALTHRWEQQPMLQTTRSNLEDMKREIDEDDLPRTFKQAVAVARCLRIRYLWIDSLCIIQKDDDDWMTEVIQMGKVYSHSYLTLSATAGGGRLISNRDARQIQPCIRAPKWKGQWPAHYIVTDFRFWDDRIYRAPTNTRCWITQERWLSPRVLHFAFDQLIWECCELDACETFFGGLPNETRNNRHTGFKQNYPVNEGVMDMLKKSPPGTNVAAVAEQYCLWEQWTKVLETYCRTETTYPRDRLLGLNLIGAEFAPKLDDHLVAGLWYKTIPGEMLWRVSKTRRSNYLSNDFHGEATAQDFTSAVLNPPSRAVGDSLRPKEYCAPSWSWASVLGDIEPGMFLIPGRDEAMIDVLDVSLTYKDASEHVLGLESGSLKLRGRLYPIKLKPSERSMMPPTLHLDGLPTILMRIGGVGNMSIETESHSVSLIPDQPEEYTRLEDCCFLPVASRRVPSSKIRTAFLHSCVEEHLRYIDEREEVQTIYGICVKPTGLAGQYQRLAFDEFSLRESELFIEGFTAWKSVGFAHLDPEKDSHPASLNATLYHEGEIGTFTIV